MKQFRVDLHIHTVLSPCGSLEMSPVNIIDAALNAKLDIIGITDHNSTKQVSVVKKIGESKGITVLYGAEVNTSEEVHCLALFETEDQRAAFQSYLDEHLMVVKNKPEKFGYQVVVDEDELIVEDEKRLLIASLKVGIMDVEKFVHQLNGLFIPAHVDRYMNGLLNHLGFVPEGLVCDAFGLSLNAKPNEWKSNSKLPKDVTLLQNSDAHHPSQIGKCHNIFEMKNCSFNEIRLALHQKDGRRAYIPNC